MELFWTALRRKIVWTSDKWSDYEILDTTNGEKLERWDKYILVRPDPQVIWNTEKTHKNWKKYNALYNRNSQGGGSWDIIDLPETFSVKYDNFTFLLKPMNFKHTGLFPEQAVNWDWCAGKIKNAHNARNTPINVLNLFAYTGAASIVCSRAGADICHVDASKGMVSWAKENAVLNNISNIRFIVDDCIKFVQKEQRRGKKYDAIIMDPPSYGRGPNGEIWKIEEELYKFMDLCTTILSDNPLFFLLNSYTTGFSAGCMKYLLEATLGKKFKGLITASEIGLPVKNSPYVLPCGASARFETINS